MTPRLRAMRASRINASRPEDLAVAILAGLSLGVILALLVTSAAEAGGPTYPSPFAAANAFVEQGQGQSQSVSVSQEGGAGDYPRVAPAILAPALVAAPETCMGSTSIGVSTLVGGGSIGQTWVSEGCELRMFARSLQALGQSAAALALLSQDARVAKALWDTGTRLSPGQAPAGSDPIVPSATVVRVAWPRPFFGAGEGP